MDALRFRYDLKYGAKQPPLAALSDLEQPIQPGMVRRGNPMLKSFRVIDQRVTMSYLHDFFSTDVSVDYRNEHKPVMTSTIFDGSRFVMTYENQRSFQELHGEVNLTLRPWREHLSIALTPSLSRYFSHGNTYSHARNIFHLGVNVDFSYHNWTFNASVMTGAANSMYGEEIIKEKDMNLILAGYVTQKWALQIGAFNIFMKDYWMKTENLTSLTPYVSKAHCGKNAYAAVKFSFNLDFGAKHTHSDEESLPELRMPDSDAGIMNGLK